MTLCILGVSCTGDLDTLPLDEDIVVAADVYDDDPNSYRAVLAKLYAGLAVSGQEGPAGKGDISGIDEGFGQYLRGYWYHQELTTDEALIAWNDQTIHDFHEQDWDANDNFIYAFYSRIFYQISICNEFLRETTFEKLQDRGVSAATESIVNDYRAEARFLRALSYWHGMDLFRNVPFVTEEDVVGFEPPEQIQAADLFEYIERELIDIEDQLPTAGSQEYGRANQVAAQMLLAKLYLNAEVYIGQNRYQDAMTYSEKVINSGYQLDEDYEHLFLADNHTSPEIIFPITSDGNHTRTWGGMTFIIHAAVGGDMAPGDYGVDGGWGGTRTTSALVEKFPSIGGGTAIATPNFTDPDFAVINVPGEYQGWDPENPNTVISSPNDDGIYTGYAYFPMDNMPFKFAQGGWDVNWGDNEGDGILDSGGENFVSGPAGMYYLTLNLNDNTYSIMRTEWGLIGSATPDEWNSDQDMTYDPSDNSFVITLELKGDNEVKFRANDDWAINYGTSNTEGILSQGGPNIYIPQTGTYELRLYLLPKEPTYSIIQPEVDFRPMFFTENQSLEIEDVGLFTDGYAVTKFKNVTSDGMVGSNLTFPDTDFPMFRLADAYLMYAEAALRANGDPNKATEYVNIVRRRAHGGEGGEINVGQLSLDFILDERAREFYWECHRRTDLIRHGQFTDGDFVWPWKGGTPQGRVVDSKYDLFPIPSRDLSANPNLQQNAGY